MCSASLSASTTGVLGIEGIFYTVPNWPAELTPPRPNRRCVIHHRFNHSGLLCGLRANPYWDTMHPGRGLSQGLWASSPEANQCAQSSRHSRPKQLLSPPWLQHHQNRRSRSPRGRSTNNNTLLGLPTLLPPLPPTPTAATASSSSIVCLAYSVSCLVCYPYLVRSRGRGIRGWEGGWQRFILRAVSEGRTCRSAVYALRPRTMLGGNRADNIHSQGGLTRVCAVTP